MDGIVGLLGMVFIMRGINPRNPADRHRHLNVHPTLALV